MEAIVPGVVLGLVMGFLPGAFFTLVATTAISRGLRTGAVAAMLPLGTELPALAGSVFLLAHLPEVAIRWVGVVGGLLLVAMAWTVVRRARSRGGSEGSGGAQGHLLKIALLGVVYPNAWIFWILIGGPITLNRWYASAFQGLAFPTAFLAGLVGARLVVAWSAARGGGLMNDAWKRRVLTGAGGVLAVLGFLLAWQSWTGNFQEMISAPERVREEVESS